MHLQIRSPSYHLPCIAVRQERAKESSIDIMTEASRPKRRTCAVCQVSPCSMHAGTVTSSTTSPISQKQPTVEEMDAAAAGAAGSLGVGWTELRNALASFLPDGTIRLDKRFSTLEQHDEFVTLHFSDHTTVDARIVVGADGCFSKVRQQTIADGLPEFTVSRCHLAQVKSAV